MLLRRERGLRGLAAMIPEEAAAHETAVAACNEAAAILADAARVCQDGTLKQRAALAEGG